MSNRKEYSLGGCVTGVRYNLTQGEDATGNALVYALPGCPPTPPTPPIPQEGAYYEIPFYHTLTVGYDTEPLTMLFRGKVRLWGSGTVEIDGHILCTRAEKAYRVWVGPTTTTGAFHTVGTTTLEGVWEEVYWVHHPDEGSYVHCILGADFGTAAVWLRKLWSFEDGGWAFPIVFDNFGTTNAGMDGTITRSETAITCTGGAYNYDASSAWDWWSSVTPGETPDDWVLSGYSGMANVSQPTYTTTAEIPDSATTGIYARWYSGSPFPDAGNVTRLCSVGPFYRPAHDPVLQLGVDPLDPV